MTRTCLSNALKLLLGQLLIAMTLTYLGAMALVKFGLLTPQEIYSTATHNLSLVSEPFRETGLSLGFDHGFLIFLCNLSVVAAILFTFYWTTLLNPEHTNRRFSWLRRHLRRSHSRDLLQKIRPFSRIRNQHLRATSFLLIVAPSLGALALGTLAGSLMAAAHSMSGSGVLAAAYIFPHGVAEIMAFLLALSVPMAAWFAIRPAVRKENEVLAFQNIDRMANSRILQRHLKITINLLLIAGLVEAHFTTKVAEMLTRLY